jgi:hypothetical protein
LGSYEQIDWDAVWWTWLVVTAWGLTLGYEWVVARLAITAGATPIIIDMILSPDGPTFQF